MNNFLKLCLLVVIVILLCAFTTCEHRPPPPVLVKTDLEIAVEQVKDEWLKPCPVLSTAPVSKTVGALLEDAAQSIGIAAECAATHNSFVDYIAPVVRKQKEQGRKK